MPSASQSPSPYMEPELRYGLVSEGTAASCIASGSSDTAGSTARGFPAIVAAGTAADCGSWQWAKMRCCASREDAGEEVAPE